MEIKTFFDKRTSTLTYVVFDPKTRDAIVIDPVLDYNHHSGQFWLESYELVSDFIKSQNLNLHFVLETHVHADHLTSSRYFKEEFGASVAVSSEITKVQKTFSTLLNMKEVSLTGAEFDCLLEDGQKLDAGSIQIVTLSTPGHTPACMSFLVNEKFLFSGDALFMPDSGNGRCDFPMGSAEDLYESTVNKIYKLEDDVQIFVGHDYQPDGRPLRFQTSVKESKESNIRINQNITKEDFIKFREQRDKELDAPKLLLPSIQVNILAGLFPKADSNGVVYLKTPLSKR